MSASKCFPVPHPTPHARLRRLALDRADGRQAARMGHAGDTPPILFDDYERARAWLDGWLQERNAIILGVTP